MPIEQAGQPICHGRHGRRVQAAWAPGNRCKSGGVRVIYYFHDEHMPLYLLTLFAKGDRANLSKAQRNELAGLTGALVSIWKAKGRNK